MRRLHQVTAIMPVYRLYCQEIYFIKALSFRHRIFQIAICRCNNINHLRQKIGVYCRSWVIRLPIICPSMVRKLMTRNWTGISKYWQNISANLLAAPPIAPSGQVGMSRGGFCLAPVPFLAVLRLGAALATRAIIFGHPAHGLADGLFTIIWTVLPLVSFSKPRL